MRLHDALEAISKDQLLMLGAIEWRWLIGVPKVCYAARLLAVGKRNSVVVRSLTKLSKR